MVLEAIKEKQTISELAVKYKLYPAQITAWKTEFLSKAQGVFGTDQSEASKSRQANEKLEDDLYAQIGRLKMENEWLKKSCHDSAKAA